MGLRGSFLSRIIGVALLLWASLSFADEVSLLKSVEKAQDVFFPISEKYQTNFVIRVNFKDDSIEGTYTLVTNKNRIINLSKGLFLGVRKLGADAQDILLCHEIGHAFGGYPFSDDLMAERIFKTSSEGQADYYATQSCVKALWSADSGGGRTISISEELQARCDDVWSITSERLVCYRSLSAIEEVADLFKGINYGEASLLASSKEIVDWTNNHSYPSNQCRVDTLVAGALCNVSRSVEDLVIPGLNEHVSGKDREAGKASKKYSCQTGPGKRPACWFKSTN